MRYPNSVTATVGGGDAATFGAKPQPRPRPVPRRPVGPQPRRKPGRPSPQRPRRPPAPRPRPPARPGKPSFPPSQHPPERTPGLPYRNPPKALPRLPGATARALLPRMAKFAFRLAGPIGWGLLLWDVWEWSQQQSRREETWTDFYPGSRTLRWWSYDPALIAFPGNGAAFSVPGDVRQGVDSVPPALGEYVVASVSALPTRTTARINEWTAGGYYPYGATRDEVCSGAVALFPAGQILSTIIRNLVVGAHSNLPGPFNSKLVATWEIGKSGAAWSLVPRSVFNPALAYTLGLARPTWPMGDNPLLNPVGAPAFPRPRPVWWSPPRWAPVTPEFPDVGPRPAPKSPLAPLHPNANSVTGPTGVIEVTPFNPPRPVSPKGPRPPGRGTKERKAGLPPWAAAIWHGVGPITEGVDLVNAVYEALPRRIKVEAYNKYGRQPTPQEKLMLIYNNIGKLNVGKAVTNIVENQVEDFVIGKFGKALGQASRNSGRPIGYGAGPAL